jgi:uncharacterized protein YcbK (DUF882 family)
MKYFTENELRCKCGCGELAINDLFIARMEALREYLGFPFIVNSYFRCEKHNKNIGGAKNSYHLKGQAMDIKAKGIEALKLIESARDFAFAGIIIYKTFIHLDIRENKIYFDVK